MPSLDIYTSLVCAHCGQKATYISVNSKIPRCAKQSSQCPGIAAKQKAGREKAWAKHPGSKEAHMKRMSLRGNASDKRKTDEYKERVSSNISSARIKNQCSAGENNPNFGGKITSKPEVRAKMRKKKANTERMGRYSRTQTHRDQLSQLASSRRQYLKRTQIENIVASLLKTLGIEFTQEFLIQAKKYSEYDKLYFRHVYDFYLPEFNLLVECDGEYWHNSIQAKLRDTKCSYVANAEGYRIVRLSETFIKSLTSSELLGIITSSSAFAVFGDFYNTIPTREFLRNKTIQII